MDANRQPDAMEAAKWRLLNESLRRGIDTLPVGWRIELTVARNDAYLSLYGTDGKLVDFELSDGLPYSILNAISTAIEEDRLRSVPSATS